MTLYESLSVRPSVGQSVGWSHSISLVESTSTLPKQIHLNLISTKGQHKIYKLESHVHQAAKKGARPSHAPMFDDVDREEEEEKAETLRLVKMQQDFGGLQLGGGSNEIAGFA